MYCTDVTNLEYRKSSRASAPFFVSVKIKVRDLESEKLNSMRLTVTFANKNIASINKYNIMKDITND